MRPGGRAHRNQPVDSGRTGVRLSLQEWTHTGGRLVGRPVREEGLAQRPDSPGPGPPLTLGVERLVTRERSWVRSRKVRA